MRGFRYIVMLMALIGAMSCVQADIDVPVAVNPGKQIQVIGHVSSFSDRNVSSRALKVGDESNTASMCLAIFDSEGECVSLDYKEGNQTFTISSEDLGDGYVTMYMVANVPKSLCDKITTKETKDTDETVVVDTIDSFLNKLQMTVDSIDIPTFIDAEGEGVNCFPMYGVEKLNGSIPSVIQIPLESIYAKVVVNILSKPDQSVAGHTPASFTLTGYEVHNVVESVDFIHGTISQKGKNDGTSDTTPVSDVIYEGSNITSKLAQSDKEASFYFYLPERFLKPNTSADDYAYPFKKDTYGEDVDKDQNGIRDEDENYRQRYKPKLVEGQNATFVRFFGEYLDHQGHNWYVSYDIYVGNDNYSNFDIEANTQYNNYVTIRGISNSNDQTDSDKTIAIDHRVNIERVSPITINLRRETLLDSHFEVRPLRIRKNAGFQGADLSNAKVKVEVVYNNDDPAKNTKAQRWVGIERSFGGKSENEASGDVYLKSASLGDNRKNSAGKRKYFTTNLTTETLAGDDGQSVEIPVSDDDETIWIYVDECTDTGDDVRSVNIRISFSLDGVNYDSNQSTDYTICQRKLFQVTYGEKTYNIEYHEEYLHNYDAEDSHGQTEYEGMPWGLKGINLSNTCSTILICKGLFADWTSKMKNAIEEKFDTKYDFYLPRDVVKKYWYFDNDNEYNSKVHDHDGFGFTKNIATNAQAKIGTLTLAQEPLSAVEYCYNKNKRDADGKVVLADEKGWYLPAVDEIEDIVMSTYGDGAGYSYSRFPDFRAKFYWSSQPAYKVNYIEALREIWSDRYGIYMYDNTDLARATKVSYKGGDPNSSDNYEVVYSSLKNLMNENDDEDNFSSKGIFTKATMMAHNYLYIKFKFLSSTISDGPVEKPISEHKTEEHGNSTDHWTHTLISPEYNDGARSRTSYARVRCVRKQ